MPWWDNSQYLEDFANDKKIFVTNPFYSNKSVLINEIPASNYKVPIQFWVYTDANWNNNGMDEHFIQERLDELNEIYLNEGTQIQFYRTCQINYINNNDYLNVDKDEEKEIIVNNFIDGVINVHYVRTAVGHSGVFYPPFSASLFSNNDGIIVRQVTSPSTLAHEIGHYFNLEHTHRNYDKGKCRQEAVSRSRNYSWYQAFCGKVGKICNKSADGFCDTPADPKLSPSNMSGCSYTGSATDEWGDAYSPDVTNIMSYANPKTCRDNFSNSQISAMVDKLLDRHYGHYFDPVERYYFDRYEPDNMSITAREIPLNTMQHHTFHWARQDDETLQTCDVDWLRFTITNNEAGGLFQIVTDNGILEDTDTEIWLYNSNDINNEIAYDDNSNGNGYSSIVTSDLTAGEYYIKIKYKTDPPFNSASDYTIQVKECAPNQTCISGIVQSGEIKVYYAIDEIIAPCPGGTFIVEDGAEVIFVSENTIRMQDGFHVEHGGKFKTIIGPIGDEACLNNEILNKSVYRIDKEEILYNEVFIRDTNSVYKNDSIVETLNKSINNLKIYPNPTKGKIKVEFEINEDIKVDLSIVSLCGTPLKIVYSNKLLSQGKYTESIDLSNLSKGIYLCRISTSKKIITEKIIIE